MMQVRSRGQSWQRYEKAARHVFSQAGEEQVTRGGSAGHGGPAHVCSGRAMPAREQQLSGTLRSNWRLLQRLADLVEAVGHDAEGVYRAGGELGTGAVFLEHLRVLEHRPQR